MIVSYVAPVCSSIVRIRLGLFGHVTTYVAILADGIPAELKMVSAQLPIGGVLEVDLPPPPFIRSAGTREFR